MPNQPNRQTIFVFGSNEGGRHGRGSAYYAKKYHGAINGQGEGIQGTSYGIPTKTKDLKVLGLGEIRMYVGRFLEYAEKHPEMTFKVVEIGCGLAGYKPSQIAAMFKGAPDNVNLPKAFQEYLLRNGGL